MRFLGEESPSPVGGTYLESDPDPEGIGERLPPTPLSTSGARRWWTRSQRIRTLAEVPLTMPLVETTAAPIYIQIAGRARHLRGLGMPQEAIGRELGVSARTVPVTLAAAAFPLAHGGRTPAP